MRLTPDDVVILPAFGVTIELLAELDRPRLHAGRHDLRLGAERLEEREALRRGRLHVGHSRQVLARGDARHGVAGLARRQRATIWSCSTATEAAEACDYIRGGGDRAAFLARVRARACRPASIPTATCSASAAPTRRRCSARSRSRSARCSARRCAIATARPRLAARFRAFDTICSATQDRQDAVAALLDEQPLDLMIVIGGYNSSNTCNLARICEPTAADLSHRRARRPRFGAEIRHKPVGGKRRSGHDRLAAGRRIRSSIGLTSGASTPDNLVGHGGPPARRAGQSTIAAPVRVQRSRSANRTGSTGE